MSIRDDLKNVGSSIKKHNKTSGVSKRKEMARKMKPKQGWYVEHLQHESKAGIDKQIHKHPSTNIARSNLMTEIHKKKK